MIRRVLSVLVLVFGLGIAAQAQTQVHGVIFGGINDGLGFSLGPQGGAGLELQSGRFNLQDYYDVSFAPKIETGNGLDVETQVRPFYMLTPKFGLDLDGRGSYLLTSQFSKTAAYAGGGLVYRPWLNVTFYFEYVQQFQPKISNGIESYELKGGEATMDVGLKSYLRIRYTVDVVHGYDQGNPVCDGTNGGTPTCFRTSYITPAATARVMFIF